MSSLNVEKRRQSYERWSNHGDSFYGIIQSLPKDAMVVTIATALRQSGIDAMLVSSVSTQLSAIARGLTEQGKKPTIDEARKLEFNLQTEGPNAYTTDLTNIGPAQAAFIERGIRRRPEEIPQS